MKVCNVNNVCEKEILVKNDKLKLVCFVFEQGKGLPNHTHNGMAIIQVVSGKVNISFTDGNAYTLSSGDVLEFDARVEHNVISETASRVLVMIIN